jgi:hypothetical protein
MTTNLTADLQRLHITQAELEELSGLDVGAVFVGGTLRPSVWRSPRRILSLCITEGLALGTAFVVGLGLALVLVQRSGFDRLGALLLGVAGAVGLGAIAWHLYQGRRAKTLATLARLLDECDRHNDMIQALQVIAELQAAQGQSFNHPEVLTALQATRASLTSALQTDQILRRHRLLLQRRQELAQTLETHLATLHSLHVHHQASDHCQFFQEALSIGLAVQQQMGLKP